MRLLMTTVTAIALAVLPWPSDAALRVNLDDQASIKQAATTVATNLWQFYLKRPGALIGMLDIPPPDGEIPWWISGAFWGLMVDYRHATGDKQYDDTIREALLFQSGDRHDYIPANWSTSIANDDQAFWALAAMTAAETKLTDPPSDQPQYLALGQSVYNQQMRPERRAPADSPCKSGLRWQILPANDNYKYINTITNACFFNLAARLGRYTGNQTYVDNAVSVVENMFRLKLIDDQYNVLDGARLPNCDAASINPVQFSYNAAILLHGAAFMYNLTNGTQQQLWKTRIDGLVSQTTTFFFPNGTADERSCEPQRSCNIDQRTFKGFLHRWMTATAQLVPAIQPAIRATLKQSAAMAVKTCTGGATGDLCSFNWAEGIHNASLAGAVDQMSVLGALLSLMTSETALPVTNATGGTSVGRPDAGSTDAEQPGYVAPATMGERAGAGVLTAVILVLGVGVSVWMNWPDGEDSLRSSRKK